MRISLLTGLASLGFLVVGASIALASSIDNRPVANSGKFVTVSPVRKQAIDMRQLFLHRFDPDHMFVNPMFFHRLHGLEGFGFVDPGLPFPIGFAGTGDSMPINSGISSLFPANPAWSAFPTPLPPLANERATIETTPEGVTIVRGPGSRHSLLR
jgi:hypothetical protein